MDDDHEWMVRWDSVVCGCYYQRQCPLEVQVSGLTTPTMLVTLAVQTALIGSGYLSSLLEATSEHH